MIQIDEGQFKRQLWKNGMGETREIIRFPDDDAFDYRLSLAEFHQNNYFSLFPSYNRILIFLSGDSLRLYSTNEFRYEANAKTRVIQFSGDEQLFGDCNNKRTQDLNLIYKADKFTASAEYYAKTTHINCKKDADIFFIVSCSELTLRACQKDELISVAPYTVLQFEERDNYYLIGNSFIILKLILK